MKSTVVDESLSSYQPMYCSREYQASTRKIWKSLSLKNLVRALTGILTFGALGDTIREGLGWTKYENLSVPTAQGKGNIDPQIPMEGGQ